MKVNLTNILLILLIVLLIWQNQSSSDNPPQPITITIPEHSGSTGVVEVETKVIRDTIYLPSKKEYIQVDKGWKEKYEKSESEKEKLKLYYESITINTYEETIVDNDTINITGKFTTRGSLLDYSISYRIPSFDVSYVPEVKFKHPDLMVGLGVETGVPLQPNSNFVMKGNLSFENSKGNNYNIGYDTENRIWLGYTKTFKIY